MRWFGLSRWAPICDDCERVSIPLDAPCGWCGERFTPDDHGVLIPHLGAKVEEIAYHAECQLRSIIGGLNHQLGKCTCCGGTDPPDPPWLTTREAARLAVRHWERMR